MPKQYEAIRDKLASGGMDLKDAKSHAARIYNAAHPSAPVTGKMESLKGKAKTRHERYGAGTFRRSR